jgi:hypothetical protein
MEPRAPCAAAADADAAGALVAASYAAGAAALATAAAPLLPDADAAALTQLPDACLFEVMRHMSAADLARCQARQPQLPRAHTDNNRPRAPPLSPSSPHACAQEVCRRWLALGREDALWQPLTALRPEFAAALARRLAAPAGSRPRGGGGSRALTAAAQPAASPWHAWYGARAQGAVRWRSAAPSSAAVLAGADGHLGTVFGVSAHPSDAASVFSAGEDARLRLWDAPSGAFLGGWDVPALQGLFNVHAFDAGAGAGGEGGEGGALGPWLAVCGFNGDVALMPLRAPPSRRASAEERLGALALGSGGARGGYEEEDENCDASGDAADDGDDALARARRRRVAVPSGAGVLLAGHAAPVVSARARGATLATCSFDGTIRIWCVAAAAAAAAAADAAAEEARADGRPAPGGGDTPSPHAPGGGASRPRAAPVFATPRTVLNDVPADAALGPHEYSVAAVCLPPGAPSRAVRGGNDSLVKVWDIERGVVTATFAGHTGWIWCLEAADVAGNVVMTGATDSTLRAWDVRAPDGGNAMRTEALPNAGPISGLAVRPAESRVVAGAFDGLVRLFDLRMITGGGDGARAALGPPLRGHTDRVSRVAATDAFVVSASFDGTLRAWQFDAV